MSVPLASDLSYLVLQRRARTGELSPPSLHQSTQCDQPSLVPYVPARHLHDPAVMPDTRTDMNVGAVVFDGRKR